MKTGLKLIMITCSIFAFTMCNTKPTNNSAKNDKNAENFDWLLGKWKRTNEIQPKETFEYWEKVNETEYHGIGFSIQAKDTVSQEKMIIIKTNHAWNLRVKVPNEKEFTNFEITKITDNQFECKNDSLSFPKLIKYWKNGNHINALVEGDSLKLSFEFERIE
jgi:hypothetical protein